MSSAIQKLTLYAPIIASSGIFAARRIGRGVDAMDDNPFFGVANFVIAGGQTLKGMGAAKGIADLSSKYSSVTQHSASTPFIQMSKALKATPTSSKFMQIMGRIFKFSSEHINDLICVASIIKVLGSDDKADTAVRETLGLGLMFTCEKFAKKLLGMPIVKRNAQGVKETIAQVPLYKSNPFLRAQSKKLETTLKSALKDIGLGKEFYNKVKNSSLPGATKGVLFVCASIAGYKLGSMLANKLLGTNEETKTKAKKVKMNPNATKKVSSSKTQNTQNQAIRVKMYPETTAQAISGAA